MPPYTPSWTILGAVFVWLALVLVTLLGLLHLYPLASGRPLPNWLWLRAPSRPWPPQHVRLSAVGRLLILLGVALIVVAIPLESIGLDLLACLVGLLGAVLAAEGDGRRTHAEPGKPR